MKKATTTASADQADWVEILRMFETEAVRLYLGWVAQDRLEKTRADLNTYLMDDSEVILKYLLPAWESIEISEEGEDGNHITSTIKASPFL